jgi:hypothetical protein
MMMMMMMMMMTTTPTIGGKGTFLFTPTDTEAY